MDGYEGAERKKGLSALDLMYLVGELKKGLTGGRFRKIYQWDDSLAFIIHVPQRGEVSLHFDPERLFLTSHKRKSPLEPKSFCMFLRKHLMGKSIINIKQHEFDRIVEIETADNFLIFELIKPGNVILCDRSYNIIMPLKIMRVRDRSIVSKTQYRYPPRVANPFETGFGDLYRMAEASDRKLIVFLSVSLGFGSTYGREICVRAGVDENRPAKELDKKEVLKLHETISAIRKERLKPVIYSDVFVSPFPLKVFGTEKAREFETFSSALDAFFSGKIAEELEESGEIAEKEKERVERIIEKQEEAKKKWEGIRSESWDTADIIYRNYGTVQTVINGIQRALSAGMSWEDIRKRIEEEQTSEAEAVKEIREEEAVVVLSLEGRDVEIDFRKSVEENAESYYGRMKKARKKAAGAEEAQEKQKENLEKLPEKAEPEKAAEKKPKRKRRKWYEKYRWFITSDGFLVVAGRNASDNEMIYKKYLKEDDLFFHADIHGASLVVLKGEGREITDEAKKEASEFAAANSKAWSGNLATIDVYCVKSGQVSKTPPSGESLPKGSFMIEGMREWYRDVELKLSVGIRVEEEEAGVIYGPVLSVRKHSTYFVTIRPGVKNAQELAREIKNEILIKAKPEDKPLIETVSLDDLQAAVPGGTGEIVEWG